MLQVLLLLLNVVLLFVGRGEWDLSARKGMETESNDDVPEFLRIPTGAEVFLTECKDPLKTNHQRFCLCVSQLPEPSSR